MTPEVALMIPDFREHLRPETKMYIGLLPGGDYRDVVKTASRLHEQGYRVIPHFTARNIVNKIAFEDYLSSVCEAAAGCEVLVLAGDMAGPVGEYHCSMQLLESGLFEKYGIRRIGVAGNRLPICVGLARSKSLRTSDRVVTDLARYQAAAPDSKIQRAHIFTFGNLAKATKWIYAITDGEFKIRDQDQVFSVDN